MYIILFSTCLLGDVFLKAIQSCLQKSSVKNHQIFVIRQLMGQSSASGSTVEIAED